MKYLSISLNVLVPRYQWKALGILPGKKWQTQHSGWPIQREEIE